MARSLVFEVGGREYTTEPVKIDRKQLYGWSEIHAFDDAGRECSLVSTDATGTVIIPKDGIGLGLLAGGRWVERRQLKAITSDGSDAPLVPSSYSRVNQLAEKVSDEEFLDCSITGFYHLPDADAGLVAAVGEDIYRFDYCYLDSYETSPAFLMNCPVDGKSALFMFVGVEGDFEFIGLTEVSAADEAGTEDGDDAGDDIDFGMF